METSIRTAQASDLPALLRIMNRNILHSTAVYDYDPISEDDVQQWLGGKQQGGWPVIVAELGGNVAGYGTFGAFRFKAGYRFTVEHSVYVDESHTGKGVGTSLLNELILLARAGGYHSMVGVIDADNKGSIGFHEKLGFTRAGTLQQAGFKFGKWLDVSFLQLILS